MSEDAAGFLLRRVRRRYKLLHKGIDWGDYDVWTIHDPRVLQIACEHKQAKQKLRVDHVAFRFQDGVVHLVESHPVIVPTLPQAS